MNNTQKTAALLVASVHLLPAVAEENHFWGTGSSAAERGWTCERCPLDAGVSGEVELGVGHVGVDSFKFGDYTGLNDEGAYAIGEAEIRYRGKDAEYWDLEASDLGLDSRSLRIDGGRQGKFRLFLNYDQIPKLNSDTAETPFQGAGGDDLTLPGSWEPADSTRDMANLVESLQDVDIEQKRKRLEVGFSFLPVRDWKFTAKFRHEEKDGTKTIGGALLSSTDFANRYLSGQASILPEPVDYETDHVDLVLDHMGRRGTPWHLRVGYRGSFFRDNNESLRWQHPFGDPTLVDPDNANLREGELALPPDNEFHQVFALLGYDILEHTRFTAHLAYGRMTQDQDFLPYSTDATLATTALPRTSLDGEVNTTLARFKLASRPTPKLRLNAEYNYHDRDNDTPQATYQYVLADTLEVPVNRARTSLPYSFTQNQLKLNAGYRFPKNMDLAGGANYEEFDRTFQEVDETQETTLWSKFKFAPHEMVDAALSYTYATRDGSDYEVVEEIVPLENPLLRKFNMADRDRNKAGASVSLTPNERLSLGLNLDYADDDYTDSEIGLTDAKDFSATLDVSYMPRDNTTTYAFYTREVIKSEQDGSFTFSEPNWTGESRDTFDTVGVGVKVEGIKNKLDIGADLVYSKSTGEIDVSSPAETPSFPDLTTELKSLHLYAAYKIRKDLTVKLAYRHEEFDSDDWAIDNVEPNTIADVLSLGELSNDYEVNLYAASVRYQF